MEFKAAVFDLDGTLLDTLDDLADSANAMLETRGFPVHPVAAYRYFVGDGMENLVRRCLPEEEAEKPGVVRECLAAYRENYAACWNVRTRPYEGIPEVLSSMTESGLKLAVLSNKAQDFSERCVDYFLGEWKWDAVLGSREGVPLKPNPAGALEAAKRLDVDPGECLYFGDTGIDMKTANRAGMFAVGVLWGFREAKELREAGAKVTLWKPREYLVTGL